ncbi:MAG TPA: MFS transporter [Burkholderiales bacterium]|nr:MFS transporter [Burkholderiales bacterium]
MHHALRAFRHPNYRQYFIGQSVSLIGMWVQQIAISWLVYRLSGSALLLGITGFAGQIAIFFLAPFGGIWADRFDRCKTLIVTQIITIILTLILAGVAWVGGNGVNVWYVITLAMLLGLVQALETPVRSSYTPELVATKTDLPSAIAFSGGMQNAGRMIGPSIAGLLLAAFSEAFCFAMNAVTKLWLIGALLKIGAAPRLDSAPATRVWASVIEGARYTWSLKPLRYLLPMLALMSFCITPYQALMPIFAAEIFDGGASMLGFLVGAAGFGGIIGMVYLAARPQIRGLMRWAAIGPGIAGIALTAFTFSRTLWFSLACMVVVGFGVIATAMTINTIIQTVCDTEKRGRVTSYYIIAFMGMHPLGCLAAGALASWIGAPYALALFGVACSVGAGLLLYRMPLLRTYIRPLYERAGVIGK